MSTASQTITLTSSGEPAWFTAMSDGTWTKLAGGAGYGAAFQNGNRITDVKPSPLPWGHGPEPCVTSYGGGGVDQVRGELLVCGGGHFDYAGNEVYALALRKATPSWERLIDPSPGCFTGTASGTHGPGQWSTDIGLVGAPTGFHSSCVCYGNGRLWAPGIWGQQTTAAGTSAVFSFDRAEKKWRAHGKVLSAAEETAGSYNTIFGEFGPGIYVPYSNTVWRSFKSINGATGVSVFCVDAITGQPRARYTVNNVSSWGDNAHGLALENTPYIILMSDVLIGGGAKLRIFDTSNPTRPSAAYPSGYYPPPLTVVDNTGGDTVWYRHLNGFVWHSSWRCFLSGFGDTEYIYKIKPDAAALANPWSAGTWTVTKHAPSNVGSGGRVIPVSKLDDGSSSQYSWGRWNIIQDMGSGKAAIVSLPDRGADQPTYVFKLPLSEGDL